jgi:hypothetical protein
MICTLGDSHGRESEGGMRNKCVYRPRNNNSGERTQVAQHASRTLKPRLSTAAAPCRTTEIELRKPQHRLATNTSRHASPAWRAVTGATVRCVPIETPRHEVTLLQVNRQIEDHNAIPVRFARGRQTELQAATPASNTTDHSRLQGNKTMKLREWILSRI